MLNEAAESAKNENRTMKEAARAHKRAFSAPDAPGINSHHRSFDPPPNSFQAHASSQYSSQPGLDYSIGSSRISHPIPNNDNTFICMFCEDCNTNSPPRKAISHIFGRNKVCTRIIPEHVWVHYCRKHYQRSRYREVDGYSQRQCFLVLWQIRRIHDWSEANKKSGRPLVVKDWTLTLRKREQKRVEAKSKEIAHSETSNVDNSNNNQNPALPTALRDNAEMNGTAVPEWLRLKCRDGYTTEEIEALMLRLQEEIETLKLKQIPDLEILPNIPCNSTETARPRQLNKRRPASSRKHRHSQSLGMNTFSSPRPFVKEQSDPSCWRYENFSRLPTTAYNHPHPQHGEPYTDYPEWRLAEAHSRDVPMSGHLPIRGPLSRPIDNSVHRTLFPIPQVQESRNRETCYDSKITKGSQYGYSEGPLPAPTHQRSTNALIPTPQEQSVAGPSRPTPHTPHSEFALPAGQYTFIQANGSSVFVPSISNYDGISYGPAFSSHHHPMPAPNPPSMMYDHNWTPQNYTYNTPERGHTQHASTSYASTSYAPRLPPPNYPYHYNQTPEAINGHPPYTPRARIPHVAMPVSEQAISLDNQPRYNQAPPANNGYSDYTPQAQVPHVEMPESEQARSLNSQPR